MSGDDPYDFGTLRVGQESARAKNAAELAFELRVVEGPSLGASFHVQGPATRHLIGSSSACVLRIADPSVSRRHCAVWIEDGALRIEDLGSTNGVFVGNVRVLLAEIGDRARIRLGGSVLEVSGVAATKLRLAREPCFGRLIGASPAMRRLYPLLAEIARTDDTVLIEGEPGTGKELLAEILHEQGPRSSLPFVVMSGGAADAASRLLGIPGRPGLLDAPGTLLIRDVCSLPIAVQRTLATTLDAPKRRARVIVTSRRNIDLDVQHERFDESLATILDRVRVELPPLRLRDGDVRLLAELFWSRLDVGGRKLDPAEARRLETQRWHGNVRELLGTVARLATGAADESADGELRAGPDTPIGEIAQRLLEADLPLIQARTFLGEEFDRRYLQRMLAAHDGNVSRAAAASGLARRYFQTLKTKHGIDGGEK
jgi:two-component system, NtrC family, response regulator HydG